PLMWAATKGHDKVVKLLLKHKPNLNQQFYTDRDTVLMMATIKGQVEIVKILLKAGADPNVQDREGMTALMRAIGHGDFNIVKELLKNKTIDVNVTDNNKWTAIVGAPTYDFEGGIIKALLARSDVDVNSQAGEHESTALMGAVDNNNTEAIKILLNKGAKIDAIDSDGWTALFSAAKNNSSEAIEMLLKEGANIDAVDRYGETALFLAVKRDCVEATKLLLQSGADVTIKNWLREAAIDYALDSEIKELLKK
ncbi:MAG: ankyrin repeat domain-containing protein, partial [Thiotrichaceae bacterium]|nr:ankyrin repeat domain-containing protein [Thiotrichaceae bacterium]